MDGRVRAILQSHAQGLAAASASDPNDLVPADGLGTALDRLAISGGDDAVRALANDYVALWARTFRTLVRHLRGRPERALALFVEEVYPFLRGDRLAARLEEVGPGRARLVVAPDLPSAYIAGLVESFVRLSGSPAECRAASRAAGAAVVVFDVHYRIAPADRVARAAQTMAALRLPLLLCAALATAVGAAIAVRLAAPVAAWRVAAVVAGAIAVQAGANALHELRAARQGPLAPFRLSRRVLHAVVALGYGVAAVLGALLALAQPLVLAFAAAGLVLSLLFGRFRNAGWGPLLAAATYPVMTLGAVHAVAPGLPPQIRLEVLLALPLGAAAAALLHLDDLADRPLDEAGGQRTLAVRLPRPQQGLVYLALALAASGGVAIDVVLWAAHRGALDIAAFLLLAFAAALGVFVQRRLADPVRLAPARIATILLLASCAAIPISLALGVP